MPDQGDFGATLASPNAIARRQEAIAAWAGRPLLAYGAGTYADEVRGFLAERGVDLEASVVDPEFLVGRSAIGTDLLSSDGVPASLEGARVVIAFTGQIDRAERTVQRFATGDVELLDCRRWASFDPWRQDVHALANRLQPLYDDLADDASRRVLVAYLNSKLLLHPGPLQNVRTVDQYFPKDLPAFMPRPDDVYVDGGAYTGDTLQDFTDRNPEGCEAYWAFEPDTSNRSLLESRVHQGSWSWVRIEPVGLWSVTGSLPFYGNGGSSARIDPESDRGTIDVACLDNFRISATSIKLDIEGAEAEAIIGAAATIARNAPRLAVAAYHRSEDLTEIPELLSSIRDDYRFYLRFHGVYSEELVLYGLTGRS